MRDVLVTMLAIYKPQNDIDWMGYKMTKNNPYTFHHIKEKRDGGQLEIKNGAILTKKAHDYLNYLDANCPLAYDKYQEIFRYLNDLDGPIPDDMYDDIYFDIYGLEYEIKVLKKYPFLEVPRDFQKERKAKKLQKLLEKQKNKTKKRCK